MRRDHGLAHPRRSAQDADVVGEHGVRALFLGTVERAGESHVERPALGALIGDLEAHAKTIEQLLGALPAPTRRSMLERHPLTWLVQVNGFLVDARTLPAEIQDEARRRGPIPDLDQRRAA